MQSAAASGSATTELSHHDLVERHLHLARRVVQQFMHRVPRHEQRDDLDAAAAVGLFQAAKAWDSTRGVPFEKYARTRVRGAVLDELRRSDWASRSVRPRARQLRAAVDALVAQLGREPTTEEIAARLGVSVADVSHVRAEVKRAAFVRLDGCVDEAVCPRADDGASIDPESVLLDREQRAYLRDAVAQLPERQRMVVIGYYLEERPMAELADLLGVTESRISQICADAIVMLREGLNSQLDPVGEDTGRPVRASGRRAAYFAAIAERRTFRARLSDRTVIAVRDGSGPGRTPSPPRRAGSSRRA
jgi:RNA polymerase sigma factor for flagellar operon FliA